MPTVTPVIPESVTVHLGLPDAAAENVTVSFPDYIKNVASSEIYPTWPENAIRANIYAQISFIMNRIYTEYYRSRGYDFDITNTTATDQSFVYGRDIFQNISDIVDQIFNSYLVRPGFIEPFFAQYCNGTTVTCDGLSQWGSVSLANQGLTPYEILQNYYGTDINIRTNVPVANVTTTAPPVALRIGSIGNDVKNIQLRLNRISRNYPAIPKIPRTDGVYGTATEQAVREFQSVFGLTQDGIVGAATWYRIQLIYFAVKRLNELNSEGLTLSEVSTQYPESLRLGDTGEFVTSLQYFLSYVATFIAYVPPVAIDGIFGEETRDAVVSYQVYAGLDPNGVVDETTWNSIYNAYRGIVQSLPDQSYENTPAPYPGTPLTEGSTGDDVIQLQSYLNVLAEIYPQLSTLPLTGVFATQTRNDVVAFQQLQGLEPTGNVTLETWNRIASEATDVLTGNIRSDEQYG